MKRQGPRNTTPASGPGWRRQLALPALAAFVGLGACAQAPAGDSAAPGPAEWREEFPDFTRHVVDDDFRGGYQGIAADVNGDGREDIVALSTGPLFRWYRNPGWEAYDIETGAERLINAAPYDIDGDGDLDLAFASSFNLNDSRGGGLVRWAEAPSDPTRNTRWTVHDIDAVPTSHRLRWADLDGDGRPELVNLPIVGVGAEGPQYAGPVSFRAYRIPANPRGTWTATELDRSRLEVAHGLEVVDWDMDGTDDLLTASGVGVVLFQPGPSIVQPTAVSLGSGLAGPRPERGSSEVGVGLLGERGRFVATMEPWHGDQVVVYMPGSDPASNDRERRVIDTGVTGGHGLVTADLNGDGYDEVIAGGRGGDRLLHIYRYIPSSGDWERIPLDVGGVAVSGLDVADLNGDGAIDIIAVGSSTGNVVWYENGGVM